MKQRLLFILTGGLLLAMVVWLTWPVKKSIAPTVNTNTVSVDNVSTNIDTPVNVPDNQLLFSTADLPDRDPAFDFSAMMPKTWRVEYLTSASAINIYDPQATGTSTLEKSQIFIKYFSAAKFLTLTTVDIISQETVTISGRPAMNYVIKKKPGIGNFIGQPAWRNEQHRVTDIRSSDQNPATFYVFAQAPNLADTVFSDFLNSLRFPD